MALIRLRAHEVAFCLALVPWPRCQDTPIVSSNCDEMVGLDALI